MSEGLIPQKVETFQFFMEDEHLLILSKDAGISTIPSREHPNGTVANLCSGLFNEKKN